ncbi:MAG TPA: hypothetical protein VGS96_05595 [Thermoanaerobaculia bacterium]|nr:hypothetical protein [Thermoanaerobaculia bacterium]
MNDQLVIRRYLLGDLPESDAAAFEEDYFASDDRFSEMLAAEDDLIEAFLQRELSASDRRLFEGRFLATSRGREKIALAAAINSVSRVTRRGNWTMPLTIAAAVFVMVISVVLLRQNVVMRYQIEQLQHQRPAPRSVVTPHRGEVFSVVLSNGLERGSDSGTTIVLPHNAETAELWLVLPHDDYPTYTTALQSVDGHTLWSESGLASRPLGARKAIVVRIPASSLEQGTFIIAVAGDKPGAASESIEDFSFSVRRP